jgi:flagellin
MRINHNVSALNAYRNLSVNNDNTSKSLEKLSSGLRINRASDDAAGLAISEKMRSQIRGLDMAQRNALDGVSVVQTAEGALNSTHEILQRMRELAVQSSNDSNTNTDRAEIQKEVDQLTKEIDRIGTATEFNTNPLLDGTKQGANAITLQIGANAGQIVTLDISDMRAAALGISSIDLSTGTGARNAITTLDTAIQKVSSERAKLGAVQNRLEYTVDNLKTMGENVTTSESRVRDLDMALEMSNFTKNNILNQAAQSMLAQANQLPQGVLQLLK